MIPGETAAIGLGANLGDAVQTLGNAIAMLSRLPDTDGARMRASAFYRSRPWGGVTQPDFINAAVVLNTRLTPYSLLQRLLDIESCFGRVRIEGERWGPRTLDLDILLYGDRTIVAPDLVIPHPRLHERAFALIPLAEIAPALSVPGHGNVADLAEKIGCTDVTRCS